MFTRLLSIVLLLAVLPGLALAGAAHADADTTENELEQSVCGFMEPLMFWLWSQMAGQPDSDRLAGLEPVEAIRHTTRDGRVLRGYRMGARFPYRTAPRRAPRGYLLVIQGNAMLADRILGEFRSYAEAGYDVYIYDFRGYGRSEGRRRLRAIVSDYREILARLDAARYPRRLVYAMSLGGIIFLDGYSPDLAPQRVVIDSAPSRLSGYGCPPEYDAVNHLPADCRNFLFIIGEQDTVVPLSMSGEMLSRAEQCGARVVRDAEFAHPLMDPDPAVHRRRMQLIGQFLLQPAATEK